MYKVVTDGKSIKNTECDVIQYILVWSKLCQHLRTWNNNFLLLVFIPLTFKLIQI